MAAEKRSQSGLLAAWAVSRLADCIPFNETRIDPNAENPFKEEGADGPDVARAKAFIASRMWAAISRANG